MSKPKSQPNPSTPGELIPGDIIFITSWSNGDIYCDPRVIHGKSFFDFMSDNQMMGQWSGNINQHHLYGKPLFIIRTTLPMVICANICAPTLELHIFDTRTVLFRTIDTADAKFYTDSPTMDLVSVWLSNRKDTATTIARLQKQVRSATLE